MLCNLRFQMYKLWVKLSGIKGYNSKKKKKRLSSVRVPPYKNLQRVLYEMCNLLKTNTNFATFYRRRIKNVPLYGGMSVLGQI